MYPTLEALHILGIGLLIGPAFAFDLRLLGAGKRLMSVDVAARYLLPLSHLGLMVALLTGISLLSAQPLVIASSAAAVWKFGLLLIAGVNILIFHRGVYRSINHWSQAPVTPVAARVAAGVSLSVWSGVVFAGRFLAYV